MNTPVCLSQYFVNKQSVRSYANVIKWKLIKQDDIQPFLMNIFQDKTLISDLPEELLCIIKKVKMNLFQKGGDFTKHFNGIVKPPCLRSLDKEKIYENCVIALSEILPQSLFGGNANHRIFKRFIQVVIFSAHRQHFIISKMIQKWNFSIKPWNLVNKELSQKILSTLLSWIVKNILTTIICLNFYVTSCKIDADENKLHYFWKNQWQSFYDKKVANMIFTKVLKRHNRYCLGKKTKRRLCVKDRINLKSILKGIPKLHLVLKVNSDCRPIVRCKNAQTKPEKYKMRERLNFLKALTGKPREKIESQFIVIYQQWIKLNKPKLFFVKTDLSNAFGSINKEKLMKILAERHMNFQKSEKSVHVKQKIAKQYKEMVEELRKPILVRAGNTVYEWTEGLVQGYKYSPALSELYYTHLDEIYFSHHLEQQENRIKFFVRVVDDYLYITDSLEDAGLFLEALSNYRNVNNAKTVVNFEHDFIKMSNEISFLGYSYDTSSLQVRRAPNVYVGQMFYKIAFTSALENLSRFLSNRIGQSGIQINNHIFNFIYNTEDMIWKHVFTTFCLSANKFCTILAVLCEPDEMKAYLLLYKKKVAVKLTNAIVDTLLKNKPKDYIFLYCVNHFRYLSFKALYLCARNTPKCSGLVPLINDEIAKTNCIFGKWKDHACRIETDGEIRRAAVKMICRRVDLRAIFKNFETLPAGFECYNHKMLK